ncbi:hypothetical protein EJ05DRAFT_475682 [Pseudovirgaria hyperparasitica]|uniref:Uncharacterized protein n=1 Tax=Pseudovirgaria hyperparasitica TaxID=470096 RepID=A0A6A6W734_9PEZI|nr:uncharacterized protein EJ05DRAFT_475682 [Pseudovirgaria hyperparasitica]KAF2758355.1 hypothetical protein EJ05DRAFT_475682 [Pseudovirgaria hyperparasitica]
MRFSIITSVLFGATVIASPATRRQELSDTGALADRFSSLLANVGALGSQGTSLEGATQGTSLEGVTQGTSLEGVTPGTSLEGVTTGGQETPDIGAVAGWVQSLISTLQSSLDTLPGQQDGIVGRRQEIPDTGALADWFELLITDLASTLTTLPEELVGILVGA